MRVSKIWVLALIVACGMVFMTAISGASSNDRSPLLPKQPLKVQLAGPTQVTHGMPTSFEIVIFNTKKIAFKNVRLYFFSRKLVVNKPNCRGAYSGTACIWHFKKLIARRSVKVGVMLKFPVLSPGAIGYQMVSKVVASDGSILGGALTVVKIK